MDSLCLQLLLQFLMHSFGFMIGWMYVCIDVGDNSVYMGLEEEKTDFPKLMLESDLGKNMIHNSSQL